MVIFLIALKLIVVGLRLALSWFIIVPLDGIAGVGWCNFFWCWVFVHLRHHYIILHFSALNIIIIFFWISLRFIFDRLFFVRILRNWRKCFLSEIWWRSLLCFGAFFEIRVRFLKLRIVLSPRHVEAFSSGSTNFCVTLTWTNFLHISLFWELAGLPIKLKNLGEILKLNGLIKIKNRWFDLLIMRMAHLRILMARSRVWVVLFSLMVRSLVLLGSGFVFLFAGSYVLHTK